MLRPIPLSTMRLVECFLKRELCLPLNIDQDLCCFLGLLHGFPIFAMVSKEGQPDGKPPTFGLRGAWYGGTDLKPSAARTHVPAGRLLMKAEVPDITDNERFIVASCMAENYWAGVSDFFGVPWDEVIAEGSIRFNRHGVIR